MRRLVALGLAAAIGALLGIRAAPPPCPAGSWRDAPRAERVLDALASTPDGALLLSRARPIGLLCFGATRGVAPDGTLLVDGRASDPNAAAYVGHLLTHRAEGAPFAPPADRSSCQAWLATTRAAEERASEVEARVARALDASYPGADLEARLAEYAALCERKAR